MNLLRTKKWALLQRFGRHVRDMRKQAILTIAALLGLAACNNYGLDDRIKAALGNGGSNNTALRLTAPANQTILIQNKNNTLATLQFSATGGNQPYTFSYVANNLPANFNLAISSAGLLTVTRNTSVGYPSTIQTSDPLSVGSISVKAADSNGTIQEVTYPIGVHFKRAFITSVIDSRNFAAWPGPFVTCANASPILAANCACQFRATAAGRLNPSKYRAWISYTAVDAKCNITNNSTLSGCATNANEGGPWYGTTGLRLADDIGTGATGLLNGGTPLQNPLNMDEFGGASPSDAFTGTSGAGIQDGNHCTNWTTAGNVRIGNRSVTDANWTLGTAPPCSGQNQALYCFEAD